MKRIVAFLVYVAAALGIFWTIREQDQFKRYKRWAVLLTSFIWPAAFLTDRLDKFCNWWAGWIDDWGVTGYIPLKREDKTKW